MDTISVIVFFAATAVVLEILSLLRRDPSRHRGHLVLLVVDLGLLGWAIHDEAWRSWQAWAGMAMSLALVALPSLCDWLLRRGLAKERLGLALFAAQLKELCAPGEATRAQREVLADLVAVKSGRVDPVLHALRARLVDAEPEDAPAIHERIITTLAHARRWREAELHYETHLGREHPSRHPALAVHMVRAAGEAGELERAAQIVHRLEQAAAAIAVGVPAIALLQARLWLVAYAGQVELLARVLATPFGKHLGARMKAELEKIAKEHAPAAAASVDEMGGPVQYARSAGERLLDELDTPAAAAVPLRIQTAGTIGLIVLNAIVYLVTTRVARLEDGYDLVRAGASFHDAVRAGEWWRLATAMFLHDGTSLLHISLNLLTLYVFGRAIEPLFGTARFLVVYLLAGLVGNVLSLVMAHGGAGLSLGASGAVFGLVGALMVTLALRRGIWPEPWRRTLLVNLLVLSAMQLYFGAVVRVIDNWAHVGGGFGGALLALAIGPGGVLGERRAARVTVAVTAMVLGAAMVVAGALAWRTPLTTTLAKLGDRQHVVGGARVLAPSYAYRFTPTEPDWPGQEALIDPIAGIDLSPHVVGFQVSMANTLGLCVLRDRAALEKNPQSGVVLEDAPLAPELVMPGWEGRAAVARGAEGQIWLYYGKLNKDTMNALVVELHASLSARHATLREAALRKLMANTQPAG